MAVDDGHDSDDNDGPPIDSSLPACPRCGSPITMTTATGPDSAVTKPCGCRVPPTALEFE